MQQHATIANGCFWCTEAVFKRLKGVLTVTSGYTGGKRENPNYDQVSTGVSGHAEAIDITFDDSILPYEKVLEIFWHTHDPTTKNQQGADIGTQYRSAIFYRNAEQEKTARNVKAQLEKDHVFSKPIVTEIVPFAAFYPAETYHQNYYDNNTDAPYCTCIIDPKISKLLRLYAKEVKPEYLIQT